MLVDYISSLVDHGIPAQCDDENLFDELETGE